MKFLLTIGILLIVVLSMIVIQSLRVPKLPKQDEDWYGME